MKTYGRVKNRIPKGSTALGFLQPHRNCLCLLFTFFLDKKSDKKIKANPIAPPDLPGQRTSSLTIGPIIHDECYILSICILTNCSTVAVDAPAKRCKYCRRYIPAALLSWQSNLS